MLWKTYKMVDYYDHFNEDQNFCGVFRKQIFIYFITKDSTRSLQLIKILRYACADFGPYCGATQFLQVEPLDSWTAHANQAMLSYNEK